MRYFSQPKSFGPKSHIVHPRLLSLSGPLKKSEFAIADGLSIGSDGSNRICLEDAAVSPSHCRISVEGGRYILTDLQSDAGTFLNGIPIERRELASGDEISVGHSVFLFQVEAMGASASNPLHLDKTSAGQPLHQLNPAQILYLDPEALAALPQSSRLAHHLSALLRISTAVASLRDADALEWQLLGMIFDVVPAERGAILLLDADTRTVSSHVAWDRTLGPESPVHISEGVLQRVMDEQVYLLDKGPGSSETSTATGATAAASSRVHSLLCVPLSTGDKPFGVIYLDTSNSATIFSNDDLQLVSAIAGIASIAIENARQFERIDSENRQLRAEVNLDHDMLGQSARMREVYQFIERVAPTDTTILIHGESGTGKELTARAIHKNSHRRQMPFVALNCAAITESLLESELFGHEKGAFTSAFAQKKGLLEVAEGGTIFLDEIGELSPILQAKLLRVLQEREFVRVGGTRPIKIDVRFLAATNKNLQNAVRENQFRADLFHRLNVISITLPALREHPEDITVLASYFAARYAKKCGRVLKGISDPARVCLMQYDWPGNVRELENAMERAVVIGSSDTILPEDLPEALLDRADCSGAATASYHDAVRNLKKQLILNSLEQSGGNFTEAAKFLGVHPNYLHRLIRNLDLRLSLKKYNRA
jgi:transcriptional regulator with GAF, ATPase, and Fis domain